MNRRSGERKTIGNYDILAKLGEGGAGIVYKARHRSSEEIVAVKVLHPQQGRNGTILKRFEQEFRAASLLDHPNLIRSLDYLEADGTVFLVMEYVEGRSLGERLEQLGRLNVPEAVAVISQIGRALSWLHDQGILHRDVKPDNIIVTPDAYAKLTDLGLAKELLFDQSLTRTGSALGTPNFMAPEQFRDAKRVDRRSDIYSLAATLYQMVTGHIPFQTSTPFDAWKKKSQNEFASPRDLAPDLPIHIDQAIRQAMNSDPANRPSTCDEFIRELTLAPEPIQGNDVMSSDPVNRPSTCDQYVRELTPEPEPTPGDAWEVIFQGQDTCDPLRVDTATIRQFLKTGHAHGAGDIAARRETSDPFKPLTSFPEFSDLKKTELSPELTKQVELPSPKTHLEPSVLPHRLFYSIILIAAMVIFVEVIYMLIGK